MGADGFLRASRAYLGGYPAGVARGAREIRLSLSFCSAHVFLIEFDRVMYFSVFMSSYFLVFFDE